jgi:hypothetical protein
LGDFRGGGKCENREYCYFILAKEEGRWNSGWKAEGDFMYCLVFGDGDAD